MGLRIKVLVSINFRDLSCNSAKPKDQNYYFLNYFPRAIYVNSEFHEGP